MKHSDQILFNNRYLLNTLTRRLTDLSANKEQRLEPRLVQILEIFAKYPGQVITRESLIQDVWKNYGGADEALSQAVSILRKVLNDNERKIITTIPKRGYQLNAEVVIPSEQVPSVNVFTHRKSWIWMIIAVVFVACIYFIFRWNYRIQNQNPEFIQQSFEIPFVQLDTTDPESFLNTVTTTDGSGTIYKLVQTGDEPPKFYVRDSLVTMEDQAKYRLLIRQMHDELVRRRNKQ